MSDSVPAVPVGARDAIRALKDEVDDLVRLTTPADLRAIGAWYDDFSQTSDAEVCALLRRASAGAWASGDLVVVGLEADQSLRAAGAVCDYCLWQVGAIPRRCMTRATALLIAWRRLSVQIARAQSAPVPSVLQSLREGWGLVAQGLHRLARTSLGRSTMNEIGKKTDSDILHDVACELAWDTRISPTEIGLQVKHGVVTFTGTVDSWAKVRAAEQAAHRVKGVLDVANDLLVRPTGGGNKTDTEIAEAVRQALEWDVTVPDQHIQSTVSHGTVRLEGTVSYWSQRADAERAIERLSGVKRVVNQIEVRPTEAVDVSEAHRAVEKALERHAKRDASRIALRAENGTVRITGVVHTLEEKAAVLGAVRGTRGVRDVADHLQVDPDDPES